MTFLTDKEEIDKSDVCLILMPLFGRDCAAEIGYSKGKEKCVIAYVDSMNSDQEKDWLNDWMVKGFIDYYLTVSNTAYNLINKNPFIIQKQNLKKTDIVFLLKSTDELSELILELYHREF